MRSIPKKLRDELSEDPFMSRCVYGCAGKPEWEHVWIYQGRQINERFSLIPVCTYHHRGAGLDKRYNEYVSLQRATPEELAKYPRVNWEQKKKYLQSIYENMDTKEEGCK